MAYPTFREDFEGGSTLGTACPELVDIDSAFAIDSTGSQAFTGTRSLKLSTIGSTHTIISNVTDTLSGNLTISGYVKNGNNAAQLNIYARATPSSVQPTSYQRVTFNASGVFVLQSISGTATALSTQISSVLLPTGIWLCMELRCNGTAISGRVVRQDNGQFFVQSGSGSWSSTPQTQSGTTTFTPAAGGFGPRLGDTISCFLDDLIIEPAVPSIDNPTFSLIGASATQQLTAGGFTDPLFGVTWSSSNTGVATVNSSGLVTAVGSGASTITATGKRDTAQTATATAAVTVQFRRVFQMRSGSRGAA